MKAKSLLEGNLLHSIKSLVLKKKAKRLIIEFIDGGTLYVQYIEYGEYSYSLIFSGMSLDRCRFDNYDDLWEVPSKPHHFHARFTDDGMESEMTGDPEHDMLLLINLYESGELLDSRFHFKFD